MAELSAHIKKADWKTEKHVPVIECPDVAKADKLGQCRELGRNIARAVRSKYPA
jgi:desulfoferrodoxin (superoxide reductase-like protein)